jgi:hypothetical protein
MLMGGACTKTYGWWPKKSWYSLWVYRGDEVASVN